MTFEDYLHSLIRWHYCNYLKSGKKFREYGCKIQLIEEDWTEYAEIVYQLYINVAKKHGYNLYDQRFFQVIAKQRNYKLLCAWFEGQIIGMSLLHEEEATLHCVCHGFDYKHSSKCYAYSWLNYELIRLAIAANKYRNVDVGLTADESKKLIGFIPIDARMDIYTNGTFTYWTLKGLSSLITATITPESRLKLGFAKVFR